jgi:hypothetical protein
MNLIKLIIEKLFCKHKWVLDKEIETTLTLKGKPCGYEIHRIYICKKCGKFKRILLK